MSLSDPDVTLEFAVFLSQFPQLLMIAAPAFGDTPIRDPRLFGGAYYVPPSEDFSRPGTVYYAPSSSKTYALFSEITTAYHEGFPGHHLQCGLQVYFRENLSRHHRLLVCCSGYAEGWALYAEQLVDEIGMYKDQPFWQVGYLQALNFRAVRLVVDTGLHAKKWTRQQAIDYMVANTGRAKGAVTSEIDRYCASPGQACG